MMTYGSPIAAHCSITVELTHLRGFGVEDTTIEVPPNSVLK